MKKLGVLAFGLMVSAAAFAQDEDSTEPTTDDSYEEVAADQEEGTAAADESASMEDSAAAADADGATDSAVEPAADPAADATDPAADPAAEPAEDSATTEDSTAADTSSDPYAADSGASDSSASDSDPSDSYSSDSDSSESGDESGGEEGEDGEPSKFYVGGDYVWSNVSFSKDALVEDFGAPELDSNFYRVRAGMRLFEALGLEAQLGFDGGSSDDPDANEYSTKQFYGVYLAPTGVLFDLVEVAGLIGYASTELERGDVSERLSGASFGVNFEIPLFTSESLELRIGGGGTVFRAQNSARIHGYHAGLRIDFSI